MAHPLDHYVGPIADLHRIVDKHQRQSGAYQALDLVTRPGDDASDVRIAAEKLLPLILVSRSDAPSDLPHSLSIADNAFRVLDEDVAAKKPEEGIIKGVLRRMHQIGLLPHIANRVRDVPMLNGYCAAVQREEDVRGGLRWGRSTVSASEIVRTQHAGIEEMQGPGSAALCGACPPSADLDASVEAKTDAA